MVGLTEPVNTKIWNRNIVLFSISSFISHFELIASVFVLYLFSKGLSMTEAMLLQAIFIFMIFITEVPSGVFADFFGLKMTLILSRIFTILGFTIYVFSDTFWGFLPGEIFIALGWSFFSGTNSALIYDSLKEKNAEKSFKRIRGITNALMFLSLGIASVIGGYMLDRVGFVDLFLLSIVGYIVGGTVLLFIREPKKYGDVHDRKYFSHLKEGFMIIYSRINLRKMILFFGVISGFVSSLYMIIQPYFESFGKGTIIVGIGVGLYFTISAVGNYFANSILNKLKGKDYQVMIGGLFIVSFAFIAMYFASYIVAFVLLSLAIFAFVIEDILIEYEVHKFTPSTHRATVLSMKGMSTNVFYVMILLASGVLIDTYGPKLIFLIMGIVLTLFFLFSLKFMSSLRVAIKKKKL